jgi:tetratricopeptide (TPR) repeat protein
MSRRPVAVGRPVRHASSRKGTSLDFLGRARKAVKGWAPAEPAGPQFYVVTCPGGHRLRGQRTDGYQALRCPTCGAGVFVLPRSPLPDPPAPPTSPRRAAPGPEPAEYHDDEPIRYLDAAPELLADAPDAVEIQWVDDEADNTEISASTFDALSDDEIPPEYRTPPASNGDAAAPAERPGEPVASAPPRRRGAPPPPRREVAAGAPAARRRAPRPAPVPIGEPAEPDEPPTAPVRHGARSILVPRRDVRGWAGRHRLGLVLAAVALLASSSIGYRMWLQRWEQLPQEAESNWSEGQQALDRGDFDTAKQRLARAASAFERLGVRDERTSEARQLAAEAAIYADLCARSLEELIDEAARANPEEWPRLFEVNYKGRAVIIDSPFVATPRDGASYRLAYVIFTGRGPQPYRAGRIDLAGFQLFESQRTLRLGESMPFGARIEAIQRVGGEWHVRFEPDSGVILTRFEPLKRLGWSPSEPAGDRRASAPQPDRGRTAPVLAQAAWRTLGLSLPALVLGAQEPADLLPQEVEKRPELVGRKVAIDGRVTLYQFHQGRGFDEVVMKDSGLLLKLPPNLRFRQAPAQRTVRAEGTLRRQGDQLVLDVDSIQVVPEDRERVTQALRLLPPGELTDRRAWQRWAARRAAAYNDEALRKLARAIQVEVIQFEALRPQARTPEAALALARQARQEQLPEPLASGLAHRAFTARARSAETPEALDRLATEIEEFLPASKTPLAATPPGIDDWYKRHYTNPEAAYNQAPPEIRPALDRRLLANVRQKAILRRAEADPRSAFDLSAQAQAVLPDRPELAARLNELGLQSGATNVTQLRRAEVLDLVRRHEQQGKAEEGRALLRSWLDFQRDRKLAANDAYGRVRLAQEYLSLLGDRDAAIALLQEAAQLDPQSADAAAELRKLGFRQEGGRWVPTRGAGAAPPTDLAAQPERAAGDEPLLDLTPDEVLARLGKPARRSIAITQGTLLIQWAYPGNGRSVMYVNFRKVGAQPARVVARYSGS